MNKLAWVLVPAAFVAPLSVLLPTSGCTHTTGCGYLGSCGDGGPGGAGGSDAGTGGGVTSTGGGATGTGGHTGGTGGSDGGIDGSDAAETGTCVPAKSWGAPGAVDQAAGNLFVDGNTGHVVLTGNFQGNLNLFGTTSTLAATGSGSVFLAGLDSNGVGLWSLAVPAQSTYLASAIDGAGNVVVAATYTAAPGPPSDGGDAGPAGASLCGAPLDASHSSFVAMFDDKGACKFATAFSASPARASLGVAPDGSIVLAGGINGVADFGCTSKPTTVGEEIFVARLDGTGKCTQLNVFGGSGDSEADGVAVGANGDVFLTGTFNGMLTLGTGQLDSMGHAGVFVADLGPKAMWSTSFYGPDPKSVAGIALVPAPTPTTPDVVVTGTFSSMLTGDDAGLTSSPPALFAVRLAGASGAIVWTRAIPGTGVASITADGQGRTAYVGKSGSDILVAELDSLGNPAPQQTLSGTGMRQGAGIAFNTTGGRLVAGSFAGTLGGVPLPSTGTSDIFLLGLCP